MYRQHCCCCGEAVELPSDNTSSSVTDSAKNSGGLIALSCGYDHVAHHVCLIAHIERLLKLKVYPLECPASILCKCQVRDSDTM